MTFKYRYRKQIIIVSILLIIFGSLGCYFIISFKENDKEKGEISLVNEKENSLEKKSTEVTEELYKVDIKGEIINPGIYSLTKESRVIDVIEKAGGLTENANTTVINLSKKIIDEMVIIIYSNQQVLEFERTKEVEKQVQDKCVQIDENSVKNDACVIDSDSSSDNEKSIQVSLNNSTKEELMTLPGIGEAKAQEIIDYRNANEGFKSIEELKQISGIGDSIFAKIKDYITL